MDRSADSRSRLGRRQLLRVAAAGFATVAAVPLLQACSAVPAAAPGSTAPGGAAVSVLRLYGFQNTTGPSADLGIQAQNGSALAAKQINAGGGFLDEGGHRYTVELVPHDVAQA